MLFRSDCQEESARLVFENHVLLNELITHHFSLNDVKQAFAMASHPADNSLKLVILP